MAMKVFYAWQSDRDRSICHDFIREAADAAITKIALAQSSDRAVVDEAPDFPEVELDHDTKGVQGTPNIVETIKKKIRDCAIFMADLTHVADYQTSDERRKKKAQNGNVLIELGYAMAQKQPEQILTVMNTAFGNFTHLPFDLHLNRKPVGYFLP